MNASDACDPHRSEVHRTVLHLRKQIAQVQPNGVHQAGIHIDAELCQEQEGRAYP